MALRWIDARHPGAHTALRYRAASRIAAAARQAVAFRDSAIQSPLEVQPLLAYYAVLHAIKVVLHLQDLNYPANTAVLQHGLSTRRAKRETYAWAHDGVYVYRSGVFQSFAAIVPWHKPLPQRFVIGDMLGFLPWTRDAVARFHEEYVHLYPAARDKAARDEAAQDQATRGVSSKRRDGAASLALTGQGEGPWYISRAAASRRGMTVEEWRAGYAAAVGVRAGSAAAMLNDNQGSNPPQDGRVQTDHGRASARTQQARAATGRELTGAREPLGFMHLPQSPIDHPWTLEHNGNLYVADDWPPPRWMIHMVLLYSLGTLCRYHPPEWSDIVHWQNEVDAYLVRAYLAEISDAWDTIERSLRTWPI